jgi:uncharacterized protein
MRGKAALMAGTFELYKDQDGKFRFRLKAGNGQIIAAGEAYESKAAALAGIESVRTHAANATVAEEHDRATTAAPKAERRRSRPSSATKRAEAAAIAQTLTVYVPRELRDALTHERHRATAAGEQLTNAGIVLQAIEDALPHLDELTMPEPKPSGLFTYSTKRAKEPGIQLGLRIAGADLDVVDQIAAKHCDGNRSLLVETALKHRYAVTTTSTATS